MWHRRKNLALRALIVGVLPVLLGVTPAPSTPVPAIGRVVGTVTGVHDPVWVWLDGDGARSVPTKHPVVQQIRTSFLPTALVVTQGTTVDFKNGGPELHDVYAASPIAYFDLGSYAPGLSRSYTFGETGQVRVGCNKHTTMHLDVLVTPNSWFAKVDSAGNFQIDGVSPGVHTLHVWDPSVRTPLPSAAVDVLASAPTPPVRLALPSP